MWSKRSSIACGVALVAGGWLVLNAWDDDVRRIERRLNKLQKLVAKIPGETQFQGAGKARRIAELFAAEFELRAEPEKFATSNRQDLLRGIVAYRARSQSLLVEVSRSEVFVEVGRASATQYARVEFLNDLGDLMAAESHPVRIAWVLEDGEWKIRKLEVLREEASRAVR